MTPRSYAFTCNSCGKTVVEACESEVCADCVMNPPGRPAAPPAPPVRKNVPKKRGVTITIRSGTNRGPKK